MTDEEKKLLSKFLQYKFDTEKKRVEDLAEEFLKKLDVSINYEIKWSTQLTRCCGTASCKILNGKFYNFKLKFSIPLWEKCSIEEKNQTIAHEVCHLAVFSKNIRESHGYNWMYNMIKLGFQPEIYHKIERSDLRRTLPRLYQFQCACGVLHKYTERKMKNILNSGYAYECGNCKQLIYINEIKKID